MDIDSVLKGHGIGVNNGITPSKIIIPSISFGTASSNDFRLCSLSEKYQFYINGSAQGRKYDLKGNLLATITKTYLTGLCDEGYVICNGSTVKIYNWNDVLLYSFNTSDAPMARFNMAFDLTTQRLMIPDVYYSNCAIYVSNFSGTRILMQIVNVADSEVYRLNSFKNFKNHLCYKFPLVETGYLTSSDTLNINAEDYMNTILFQ